MASWMVHLKIADALLDRLKELDETAFVIGNIAPDSGVPNEDWSVFTPPRNISHFKGDSKERTYIGVEEFADRYFTDEKIRKYNKREYSFFLGYYTHLLTDREWTYMTHSEGVNEENARKENMSLIDFIWKNKADWYDLDFLYLEEHPDFRAFNIYENATKEELSNDFMEEFPDYAFENRREYICGFYRSDNHGDLHREYKYLTKERAERFVKETVDIIMDALDTRNDGKRAIGE